MSFTQRIRAISVTHPLSMNRKIDQYLSERLPDMMDDHKVADRTNLSDLDGNFNGLEKRIFDLGSWRQGFEVDIENDRTRMARLKVKYGIK